MQRPKPVGQQPSCCDQTYHEQLRIGILLTGADQCMPGAAVASGALSRATSIRKRPACRWSPFELVPSSFVAPESVHKLLTSTLPEPAAIFVGCRRCLST